MGSSKLLYWFLLGYYAWAHQVISLLSQNNECFTSLWVVTWFLHLAALTGIVPSEPLGWGANEASRSMGPRSKSPRSNWVGPTLSSFVSISVSTLCIVLSLSLILIFFSLSLSSRLRLKASREFEPRRWVPRKASGRVKVELESTKGSGSRWRVTSLNRGGSRSVGSRDGSCEEGGGLVSSKWFKGKARVWSRDESSRDPSFAEVRNSKKVAHTWIIWRARY